MPAMDFPTSPTNGQTYGQYYYDGTKGAWRVTGQPGSTVIPSPTAPTSPSPGNLWVNTNDGVLFWYYDDGNSTQWVEVKSNTASGSTVAARVDALEAKPSGLVPIVPTSVTVSSGSASIAADGTVTLGATVGSIRLNGVFNSTYKNYRIIINGKGSATSTEQAFFRLSASGTDAASGYFMFGSFGWINSGSSTSLAASGAWNTTGWTPGYIAPFAFNHIVEVFSPYETKPTNINSTGMGQNDSTGAMYCHWYNGFHNITTAYDGFTLFPNTQGMAAGTTFRVYGYR